VTFGEDDVYQQSDAAGFIRLFALPARVRALKDQEMMRAASVGDVAAPLAEVVAEPADVPLTDSDSAATGTNPSTQELAVA
jgi:hypothetical protein